MTTKKTQTDRPVLVTTINRGVFFGYATKAATDAWEKQPEKSTLKIRASRCCVYWSADVKGFMGLAANGPTKNCKIGPAADITVRNVTAVLEVTADADKAWQAAPWA